MRLSPVESVQSPGMKKSLNDATEEASEQGSDGKAVDGDDGFRDVTL